jgi:hypothetical protein
VEHPSARQCVCGDTDSIAKVSPEMLARRPEKHPVRGRGPCAVNESSLSFRDNQTRTVVIPELGNRTRGSLRSCDAVAIATASWDSVNETLRRQDEDDAKDAAHWQRRVTDRDGTLEPLRAVVRFATASFRNLSPHDRWMLKTRRGNAR